MASASPIYLMARASSTKSWLWHQRLSHLNFNTINDLARNELVAGLSKFKYHKEHLCPSCEQGKSKRASHPPKPVPNSRPAGHKPHSPSMNHRRPTMNCTRPYKTFFQTPSFETIPFLKSSAVNNSYRAPWVSTANSSFVIMFLARIHMDILSKGVERLNELETLLYSNGDAMVRMKKLLVDWGVLDEIGIHLELKRMFGVRFKEDDELVFIVWAWCEAFKVKDVYKEWCLEFFSTLWLDDQIKVENITKDEISELKFRTYLEVGEMNFDKFPIRSFWESISKNDNGGLDISNACSMGHGNGDVGAGPSHVTKLVEYVDGMDEDDS
nr:retrovirus-related Pol polyprotein from transposon TNT 1-94 [Tanacetum cinerariifolium]